MKQFLYLSDIREILNSMGVESKKIIAVLENSAMKYYSLNNRINNLLQYYEKHSGDDLPVSCNELRDILDMMLISARKTADTMYGFSNSKITDELSDSEAETENHIYTVVDKEVDRIEAHIEECAIYIRTPLLFSRNMTKRSDPFLLHSIQAYADGVSRAIEADPNYETFDRITYQQKTVFFLFAHDQSTPYIDNDNYDTTAVTNSIVGHLPGGDSPISCRMVYDSVKMDGLSPGTYITVLPNKNYIPPAETIVEYWLHKS